MGGILFSLDAASTRIVDTLARYHPKTEQGWNSQKRRRDKDPPSAEFIADTSEQERREDVACCIETLIPAKLLVENFPADNSQSDRGHCRAKKRAGAANEKLPNAN